MAVTKVNKETFVLLTELKTNNNRAWFDAHKDAYEKANIATKALFQEISEQLKQTDFIDSVKVYRIYRDVRFSKDKTPYKTHFGGVFHRVKPEYRGGYYLHIEPGNTFVAGGFWQPSPEDLLRIRKEFEADASGIKEVLGNPEFQSVFGGLVGESIKTAPKGFDKNHPNIDFIRWKQFIVEHHFDDKQALSEDFSTKVVEVFQKLRPFFDYMSEILTTDLNGEPLY
ncbi:MAG: DUF2461 domain-containing protein [Flavobacteriaceae bacterium]|nr:DUF2461 domain-containing protein [Flavobacteriaceae bacterium]